VPAFKGKMFFIECDIEFIELVDSVFKKHVLLTAKKAVRIVLR